MHLVPYGPHALPHPGPRSGVNMRTELVGYRFHIVGYSCRL